MPDTRRAVEPRPDTHPLSLSMAYLGHSTVLIDIGGVRVLTDPILRRRVGPLVRAGAPVDPASWSRVDVVLISHSHWDHLDYGSLRLLGTEVAHRGAPGHGGPPAGAWLPRGGRGRARRRHPGRRPDHRGDPGAPPRLRPTHRADRAVRRLPPVGGAIGLLRGRHGAVRGHGGASTGASSWPSSRCGAGVRAPRRRSTSTPSGAAHAVRLVRPRIAVPIHWGTLHPIGLSRVRPQTRVDPPHDFARLAASWRPKPSCTWCPSAGRCPSTATSAGADERRDPVEHVLEHRLQGMAKAGPGHQLRVRSRSVTASRSRSMRANGSDSPDNSSTGTLMSGQWMVRGSQAGSPGRWSG